MSFPSPYPRLAVLGSSRTDLFIRTDRIAGPGETVRGRDFLEAGGGKGANQAMAAARLGAHVTFIARLGDDFRGQRALQSYRAAGIDTRYLTVDPEVDTGVAMIVIDGSGDRAVTVQPGANAGLGPVDAASGAMPIRDARVLLVQLEVPVEASLAAIEIARDEDTMVVLDPSPARRLDASILASADVITPDIDEAHALLEGLGGPYADPVDLASVLRAHGPAAAVVTCGSRGVAVADGNGARMMPACAVEAIDPAGAGDTFRGALAVGLAEHGDLERAVEWAQRVAAVAVTREGAQPSMPTREEVERLAPVVSPRP